MRIINTFGLVLSMSSSFIASMERERAVDALAATLVAAHIAQAAPAAQPSAQAAEPAPRQSATDRARQRVLQVRGHGVHKRQTLGDGSYIRCTICSKKFRSLSALREHSDFAYDTGRYVVEADDGSHG